MTQIYQNQWNDVNGKLLHAIIANSESFTFQFFIFDSDDSTAYVYRNYRSQIRDTRYGIPNAEHDTRLGNCVIYWIKTRGTYTVCVRAANTMLFACCDQEEHAAAIDELVNALGYFPH